MTTSEWVILAAIVLYMIMMIAIGVGVSRKTKTSDDFYLGGRKLGPLVTAMSAEASDMSAYLLMGIPGLALMCGFAEEKNYVYGSDLQNRGFLFRQNA